MTFGRRWGVRLPPVEFYAQPVQLGQQPAGTEPEPPVEVIEPRQGWWRSEGGFGRRIEQQLPAEPNVELAIGNRDDLPGPPRSRPLSLFRVEDEAGSEVFSPDFMLRARVTYGAGGIQHFFECDWLHGVNLSVVCDQIRVSALALGTASDQPYTAPQSPIVLGYTLGDSGPISPSGCAPTYTTQERTEFPNPGTRIAMRQQVPRFARRARFIADRDTPPDAIAFGRVGGFAATPQRTQLPPSGDAVTLPNWCFEVGAFWIAGAPANVRGGWVFDLGL